MLRYLQLILDGRELIPQKPWATLMKLFCCSSNRAGIPEYLIVDESKEQVLGSCKKKCSEAGCSLKHTEPYCTWQNVAEGTIRELKRGSRRKMTK